MQSKIHKATLVAIINNSDVIHNHLGKWAYCYSFGVKITKTVYGLLYFIQLTKAAGLFVCIFFKRKSQASNGFFYLSHIKKEKLKNN